MSMTNSWPICRLGNICKKIGSGATPRGGSGVYLAKGDITLIRSQNIYNFLFAYDGLVFISVQHARQLSNVQVESGDILLNITGDSVARCWQVPDEVLPARVNQHVAIIRPDSELLDSRYLRYSLVSPTSQGNLLSLAKAGATRNALTKAMIEDIRIPVPPLTEQCAIAHVLGTLDDKIELNRQMNQTLDELARTLYTSWFVNFDPVRAKAEGRQPEGMDADTAALFPDRLVDSELGPIPVGWEIKTLGEKIELAYGKALKAENRQPGSVVVMGSNGTVGSHIQKLCDGPGIVVGRKGNPGTVHWVDSDFWPIDTAFFVRASTGIETLPWWFYALERQHLSRLQADSAVPGLNRNLTYRNSQVMPSTKLIRAFTSTANPLFSKRNLNQHESKTLIELRDTLLPELLSGRVRVGEAKDLVGEVM